MLPTLFWAFRHPPYVGSPPRLLNKILKSTSFLQKPETEGFHLKMYPSIEQFLISF